MIPLPEGVVLKIESAEADVKRLRDAYEQYTNSSPVSLVPVFRPFATRLTEGGWGLKTKILQPPPGDLSVLAGVAIQATRQVLDHLANALVRSHGNVPVAGGGGTSFPVMDSAPSKPLAIRGGVDPRALAIIDSVQPHHRREPSGASLHV